jgi:arylsulfatase A-like enzyme
MVTKTDEEKAREAFKQELIASSTWGLRKKGSAAGLKPDEMKAAEAEGGPDKMVELILEKYDGGWRPNGEALNTPEPQSKPKPAKRRSKGKKAPEKQPKAENQPKGEEEESEDPWNKDIEDLDSDEDDLLSQLGLDEDDPDPDPEPDPEPEPETTPEEHLAFEREATGLEDKVDQIHDGVAKIIDLMNSVADTVVEVSSAVNAIENRLKSTQKTVLEHKEVAVRAWALLMKKVGVKNLSVALKKGAEQAETILNRKK